ARICLTVATQHSCRMQVSAELVPNPKASAAAALLAETAPALVDVIREEARRQKGDASVSQLRALSYVSRHAEASLSEVAAVVGLSLPATSRLMDGLVE